MNEARTENQRSLETRTDLLLSLKALAYIDTLVEMEGFGGDREEVIYRLIWDGLSRLIESGRLEQR